MTRRRSVYVVVLAAGSLALSFVSGTLHPCRRQHTRLSASFWSESATAFEVSPWDATAAAAVAAVAAIAVAVRTPRCRGDGVSTAVRPPAGLGIVELLSQLRNAFDTQETWVKEHGKIFETWTPLANVVCLSDPAASRYIAVKQGNNYRDPCAYGRDLQLSERIEDALGPGSSFPSFEAWRWRKQSLQGELSFQRLLRSPELLRALVDLGEEMCQTLDAAAATGSIVRMNQAFSRATAGAVFQLLFGRRLEFDSLKLEESTQEVMECLEGLLMPLHLPGQKDALLAKRSHAHSIIDAVVEPELEQLLEEVRSGQRAPDRAPALLEAMLLKEPRWQGVGLENLLAEVRNFVNAGYEIQAFSLSFTVGFLAEPRHRRWAETARHEAVSIMESSFESKSLLSKTEAMQDIFNEALRLLPPTPTLTGVAYDDFEVALDGRNYLISKDTTLNFQVLAGQRSSDFGRCPLHFDPSRWQGLKSSKLMTYNFGAHSCPGRDMSSLEARVWLPMLLSRFRFELVDVENMEVDSTGLHLKPKDGLKLRVFRI